MLNVFRKMLVRTYSCDFNEGRHDSLLIVYWTARLLTKHKKGGGKGKEVEEKERGGRE